MKLTQVLNEEAVHNQRKWSISHVGTQFGIKHCALFVGYNHIFLAVVDSAKLFWGHAKRTGEDSEPDSSALHASFACSMLRWYV